MIKFKLIGAVLVVSAIQMTPVLTPASAQVSEPAAAEARDPNFSIYSSGPPSYGYSGAMAQTLPDEAWAPQPPVRIHHVHHSMKHR
jgi:hypothetical protein